MASRVRRPAHDTGLISDLNGDGVEDLTVGSPGPINGTPGGSVQVFIGGTSGLSPSATVTLRPPGSDVVAFGSDIARVGDVNGDGFGDIVATACILNSSTRMTMRAAYRFLGSVDGVPASPSSTWIDNTASGAFEGPPVAGAGDIDGDGYADVVIGSRTGTEPVVVFRGASAGWMTPPLRLPAMEGGLGLTVAGVGDANGDNYDDIVVSGNRQFYVYYGSTTGFDIARRDSVVYPLSGSPPGPAARAAGDINNDGLADIIIAGASTYAWVPGSSTQIPRDSAQMFPSPFVDASMGADIRLSTTFRGSSYAG